MQTTYEDKPDRGYQGQLAQPNAPYYALTRPAEVGTGERKPRPGDAVIWDATTNRFKCPATGDANLRNTVGIVQLRHNLVARGAVDQVIEYEDGAMMTVITFGIIYVRVNSATAIEFGTPLKWNAGTGIDDESDWEPWTGNDATPGTTAANLQLYAQMRNPVILWEPNGVTANTDTVVAARIGYGRF